MRNKQGIIGIRQWSINLCTSPMLITPFCRLVQLVVETFGPILDEPTNQENAIVKLWELV